MVAFVIDPVSHKEGEVCFIKLEVRANMKLMWRRWITWPTSR